jgi:ABC-type phosphate transport system substrate-binding protein
MRFTVRTGVITAGAAAALLLGSGVAQADPSVQPNGNDLAGVGSDTTMLAMGELADVYNATLGGGDPVEVASWDAIPAGTIWIKDANNNGVQDANETINRPNGSSAGINELRRDATCDGAQDGLASWARSSRARQASDSACGGVSGAGVQVLFLPFASDDLKYTVNQNNGPIDANNDGDTTDAVDFPGDTAGTNAPLNLTTNQLRSIFNCTARTWNLVGGGTNATINPKAPQAGSGTRQSFLDSLGLTAYGSCVNDTVQEHDAHAVDGDPNAIAPFSVGRFNTALPTDGSGAKPSQLNTGGYLFPRPLFNVVVDQTPADGTDPGGVGSSLQPFFGDNDANFGWLCSDDATATITANGFTQLDTIDEGEFVNPCGIAQ